MDTRFTNRSVSTKKVKEFEDGVVLWDDGWSFSGFPADVLSAIKEGETYILETVQFSIVTGMATVYRTVEGQMMVGEWLWHKTDEDLRRDRDELIARQNKRRQEILEANREDWVRRESALPEALRRRLERFRANGGGGFENNGWGYELVASELAVLYYETGGEDTPEINAFAEKNGTSENQHSFAQALSKLMDDEEATFNMISAFTPLSGDPDYSKEM